MTGAISPSEVVQVVSADGEFDDRLESFVQSSSVANSGTNYQIIAITGPQSSGKSTLMNALFGTNFEEMDAFSGRRQTTKGIWLAKSEKLQEPVTLVMDLEGSDGRERGEDDNSFERQSSLFALAVADILVVNMWAKDVGREAGAGKPLLRTIFQVNLKLFTPDPSKQRTVLLFVFRDRTKTPLQRLIQTWEEDLEQMWASFAKPPQYTDSSFSNFFEVKYSSLPNYEDREEEFMAECVLLRRRFAAEEEDTLVRHSSDKLPGNSLAMSLKNIWEVIRDQKDLNLPAHKVMVANVRCEEIMRDRLETLRQSDDWEQLSHQAAAQLLPDFGLQATRLVEACLSGYDVEATYFEVGVRTAKRNELLSAVYEAVQPMFNRQVSILRDKCLESAREALSQAEGSQFSAIASKAKQAAMEDFSAGLLHLSVHGAPWDTSSSEQELQTAIDNHIDRLVSSKMSAAVVEAEKQLSKGLTGPVISLLDTVPADLWPRLNRLVNTSVPKQWKIVLSSLQGYGLEEALLAKLQQGLHDYAQSRVAGHVREAANTVLSRMKDRFQREFTRDEASLPRRWGPRDNITDIMHKAFRDASFLLAQLSLLRLGKPQEAYEVVDVGIRRLARDLGGLPAEPDARGEVDEEFDIHSASEWPGVSQEAVLLTPLQCRQHWRQFTSDSSLIVQQAQATQEAKRAASSRMPPLWTVAAIALLGLNEFKALLFNPLLLLVCIIIFLFAKTVYTDLDIDGEMQAGLLPGVISIMNKLVPTIKQVSRRTLQKAMQFAQDPSQVVSEVGSARGEPVEVVETSSLSTTSALPDHSDSLRQRLQSAQRKEI